jgi:hypothetical protein
MHISELGSVGSHLLTTEFSIEYLITVLGTDPGQARALILKGQ